MYHLTPEEIRQRFLLIDKIDALLPYVILGYSIPWLILAIVRRRRNPIISTGSINGLWYKMEWKLLGWWVVPFFTVDMLGHLLIISVFGYFIWKTFYAFY